MPRLLIAASGTGGHIYPALSVAEAMPSFCQVSWLGVSDRLETKIVPSCYDLSLISGGGLQGNIFRKLFKISQLLISTIQVCYWITHKKVTTVFTTGGYIAAPAILAALCCRVPVILHESNAMPGRVTRLLGRFCQLVALGYPEAALHIGSSRTLVTGTPIRAKFLEVMDLPDWVPSGEGPLILVMGGSQGAVGLNKMVGKVMPAFLDAGCRFVHLTGESHLDLPKIEHPKLVSKIFTEEIPALLQHADLVISRAGASALSEINVCRTPSILIPFPYASDNHQEINASCVAKTGASVIIHENNDNQRALYNILWKLLENKLKNNIGAKDLLYEMKNSMQISSCRQPEKELVNIIMQYI